MQDPKKSKEEDIDFESMATPVEDDFDFEAIATPIEKKNSINESTQPLPQGTEGSAMGSTESTAVDMPIAKNFETGTYELSDIDVVATKDPYKVDGKKVKAPDLTKMLYDPSFIDALQSGKSTVEFPENDEAMKYLVERQKNAGTRKGDVWNSLVAGTEDMLAGVVGLDSYVANVMRSIPGLENTSKTPQEIVSEIGADNLRMRAEKEREKIRAYEDGFVNEVKSGNWGNAAAMTFNTLAESTPFMVGVGATMGEGILPMLAVNVPITASKEFAKDDTELTNRQKVLRSTVYGGAEVGFGVLPTVGIFNKNFGIGKQFVRDAVQKAFEVSGKEAAERVATDVAKKTTLESLKALGVDVSMEVGGEMATTLTQMGVDDALGLTNYTTEDYQKQLLETAAISLAMTGVMTSPSIKRIVDSSIKFDKGATIKSAVFDAVEKGVLDAAQAKSVMDAINPRVDAVNSLPADVAANTETVDTAAEIKRLEAESEAADETGKAFINPEINALRKEIAIPLPDKYVNSAGKNTSELKDGQLYITRKGDVRMWDAAQEQFLEAPKTTQVKLGTEVELEPTVTETKVAEPELKQETTTTNTGVEEGSGVGGDVDLINKIKQVQSRIYNEDGTNKKGATKEDIELNDKLLAELEVIKNKPTETQIKEPTELDKLQEQKNELSKQKDEASKAMDNARAKVYSKDGLVKKNVRQVDAENLKNAKSDYDNISKQIESIETKQKELREQSLKETTKAETPTEKEVVADDVVVPKHFATQNQAKNIETAKNILGELGVDADFSGYSDAHGVSVYFTNKDGKKIRVSTHGVSNKDRIANEVLLQFDSKQLGVGGKVSEKSRKGDNLKAVRELLAEEVVAPTETVATEPAPVPETTEQDFKTLREEGQAVNQDEEIKTYLADEEAKIRRASERLMEIDRLKGMPIEDESDYKEAVIADNMGRVSEQSFTDFSDENFVNDEIRGAYFPNSKTKRVMTLDQLADEISGHVGMPISVQDIVDFIIKYPEGVGNRRDRKDKTFYAGNNPVNKRAELLADAETILGYNLDEEGLERFAKESADLADKIAQLEAKPISDADVDALNLEYEEYLKSLTDGQRKRELAKQRIEGEQIVEGAEDANLKAIKDRDAEAREAEEGIIPIVEQVAETIEDRIAKAKAALKERNAGKLRSGLDFENLDLYTELAYLYIRKGIKSASEFAKELGEELSDAIKKAWDAANENYKAETENFDKWKAYAKKQFEAEDGGLEFQDFKARFNKKFNVAADDVALVEIFSEAQSEYNAERGVTTTKKEVDKSFKPERKKVVVDEKTALKDQLRLEAKAAKEGFREARNQQQSFADRIKAFLDSAEVKGKLSPTQVKSLINRASNIKTELQLDRFIDYAEKVIDNVNYDAEMNEIRRQQKVAKSRKHTSMQKAVNEFLAINTETIPDNLMSEYQKALDELSGRVPSYKTFQDIYHQVMALNTPKDNYSNVKTYNDALELYDSIAVNKVTSIEEYRQLFKDINAFKRKVDALFENGDITEQEYTDLLEQVGKDQKTVEDKYASEIYSLKTDLILEMKNMFSSVSLQNITEEGKDLLRRLNKLNNNDLRNLSPEEIYNLTSILDNIRETGYVDAFRLNSIIAKSNGVLGGKEVGSQIQKAKPFSSLKASVKEISDKLSEAYSSFWEDKLGLGSREAGAYYNNIVSPMERAVSSYREAVQNGYKKMNELKKKHSIKQESMDRIGLFASYLREYGLGQDVDTKGKKDSKGDLFGTRDWFKTILEQQKETQTVSKNDIGAMQKAWESLPKTNGKVDIEALEKSYRDGTNQFLSKNEMEFLKEMMAWKDENLTGKQQAANEFRGKGFNPLLYHIKRIRKDGKQKDVTSPIEITEQGNVRIAAGSGKEVQTNEVGAIEHNFEKIFSNNLEETMRDYYMTPMLQQASQVLSNAEKTAGKRNGYVEVMRKNLADAVNNEFAAEETNKISRFFSQSLLKARAAQVLIAPLRTVGELVSSLVSYPMRTREMGSYLEIFRKKDVAQKLLNATGSPFKDKANINKHFDVQDGSLKEQGKFDLATGYFAAMPERAGLLPVWMASFDSAFKKNAGVDFDRDAYMNDPAYEKKYQRDIDNAASQADALYGEIAGSPTKAGQRREVRFAPSVSAFGKSFGLGNTVSANSPVGKVVAFMTGYPFREVEGMLKAGSAMKESVKDADASKANVAAQALPIVGSILGAATYGLFQSLNYELGNLLLGDDEEKKQAKDNIETLTSPMGLLKETLAGTTSLLASKYSGAGRQIIKWMGSLAYNMSDDEKNKVAIRSMIRNVTFQDPYEIKFTKNGKVNKFMQKEKIAKEITDGIAPLTVFVDNTTKAVEAIGGYQYLRDKINKGELLTEPEKEAVVLMYLTANALNMAGMFMGTGIPVTTLNKLAKKAIKEKEDTDKSTSKLPSKNQPLPTRKTRPSRPE